MHINPYRTYLNSLAETKPDPPFSEIRNLVLQNRNARRIPLLYRYAAGAILAGLLIGSEQHMAEHDVFAKRSPDRISTQSCIIRAAMNSGATSAIQRAVVSRKAATLESSFVPVITAVKLPGTVPVHFIPTPNVSPSSLAVNYNTPKPQVNRWAAFVAFSPAALTGGAFASPQLAGGAGLQYNISTSSSLFVEIRQTEFQRTQRGQAGALRDTMLTVGGQPYRSTIGGTSSSPVTGTERIASLDVGYRFLLNPDHVISPEAELLVGASTSGMLASESLGMMYQLNTSVSLNVAAREMQFYSSASVPLNTFAVEAAMEFGW